MDKDNILAIVGLVLIVVLSILAARLLQRFFDKKKEEKTSTDLIHQMVADAFIIAIEMVMIFVPNMAFIGVGPFSFTLLHLPVLLGAALFGARRGAIYGLVFGLGSWFKALTGANNAFDLAFQKIWVSVPPRLLFGVIAGLAFSLLRKLSKGKVNGVYLGLVAAAATCVHTVLVFADLILSTDWIWNWLTTSEAELAGGKIAIAGFLALGMAGEATLGAILTPTLYKTLTKAIPSLRKLDAEKTAAQPVIREEIEKENA